MFGFVDWLARWDLVAFDVATDCAVEYWRLNILASHTCIRRCRRPRSLLLLNATPTDHRSCPALLSNRCPCIRDRLRSIRTPTSTTFLQLLLLLLLRLMFELVVAAGVNVGVAVAFVSGWHVGSSAHAGAV
jgi:hypothetical protein